MGQSAFCLNIFTDDYKKGIDSLLQFAVAIMLDKPIFLLVPHGVAIPEKVKLMADGIEYFEMGNKESTHDATMKLMQQAKAKGFARGLSA